MKRLKNHKIQIFTVIIFAGLAILFFASCESKQQKQARLAREEQQRIEQELHNKYIDNSLHTGATPYSDFYGVNRSCSEYGCSQISVRTPSNSDVLVTVKKNDRVVRHAYIRANSSYTFELPDGTYQTFFYYGKGWNPEKTMKTTAKGVLKGGFVADETFGKDDLQTLNNDVLTYELILQQNGNFSTRPSNAEDAL
jgi:hypothetical protein